MDRGWEESAGRGLKQGRKYESVAAGLFALKSRRQPIISRANSIRNVIPVTAT
jgi:hypothetical protein